MNSQKLEHYRSMLLYGVGCLLVGCVIFWEYRLMESGHTSSVMYGFESHGDAFKRISDDKALLLPRQNYQEMVSVPLFFEGREEVAYLTDSHDDGSLKLTGIVVTPKGYVALIRDDQGVYHKLDSGSDVQGWTVTVIQKDRVELARNSETRELILFDIDNKHDLTAQELEDCFKNQADLPLEECIKHPEKFARKSQRVSA
jgi:hypothetical protein